MKKTIIILLAAAALVSCAKTGTIGKSTQAKLYLDEYMAKYHPEAVKTCLGVYIFPDEEIAGTGIPVGDSLFIRMDYSVMDIKGNYSASTLEIVNRQLELYRDRYYYGPQIIYRGENNLGVGIEEMLLGCGTAYGPMKVGGTRKALIPGWLSGVIRYDSEEEYINNVSGANTVYKISLKDAFGDEEVWEKDSVARYVAANFPGAVEDEEIKGISGTGGWYYIRTKAPLNEDEFTSDSEIYCNYTLRRLDGTVIDSNIKEVAQDNDFYSSSTTYEPKLINWKEDYTEITMTSGATDVVDGFANAFLHMHARESGIVIFWSYLGYYATGSGKYIPPYCPLRFDIDIVEKP